MVGTSQVTLDHFTHQNPSESALLADESTFELEQISKVEFVLTTEEYIRLRQMVALERRDHESIYVLYSPYLKVYIPSREELNAK